MLSHVAVIAFLVVASLENSYNYTMVCLPVRGDNLRDLASGLSPVQVANHGITISCTYISVGILYTPAAYLYGPI